MEYILSDGRSVNLYSNNDVAKFVFLKLPDLGLSFVGDVPHLRQTEQARKIHGVAQVLSQRKADTRARLIESKLNMSPIDQLYADHFDDDIPF